MFFKVELPNRVLQKAQKAISNFIHCEETPSVRIAYVDNTWRITDIICSLKNSHNRGCVGVNRCDACKIKKETGKYPGEDIFNL